MNDWNYIYITDKGGEKYFRNNCSPMSTPGQIRELKRHIEQATRNPKQYPFLDTGSAVIMMNGEPLSTLESISDEELLRELGI